MSGDSDCMLFSNPRMTHAVVAGTHFSMAKILIRDTLSKYKRGVSVVDIKLRARAFFLWRQQVKRARALFLWRYPIYMNPDCFNYCQAPCARPESFPGYGSYCLRRTRGVIEMLVEMLPEPSASAETFIVLLDSFSGHLVDEEAAIAREKGHVILVPCFGTMTSLMLINDTHVHGAFMRLGLEWSANEHM